jgi:integrase
MDLLGARTIAVPFIYRHILSQSISCEYASKRLLKSSTGQNLAPYYLEKVSKFKLQNQRYRYLLPDEEPALLAQCTGNRKHLGTMIPVAIGTRARKSEQLDLKVGQVDFFRNLVVFNKTKSGKTRVVEINSEVRQILHELCKGKRPDDYVWVNPLTGDPLH